MLDLEAALQAVWGNQRQAPGICVPGNPQLPAGRRPQLRRIVIGGEVGEVLIDLVLEPGLRQIERHCERAHHPPRELARGGEEFLPHGLHLGWLVRPDV